MKSAPSYRSPAFEGEQQFIILTLIYRVVEVRNGNSSTGDGVTIG